MATANITDPSPNPTNSIPKMLYPLKVYYCGICTMPIEYCEFSGTYGLCQSWLRENLPEVYSRLVTDQGIEKLEELSLEDEKKKQSRGGKGTKKAKIVEKEKFIKISTTVRAKGKYVTTIRGLNTFDIDLKLACKLLSKHFSRGASITGEDEIIIQGEVDDIEEFIVAKWPEVDENSIHYT